MYRKLIRFFRGKIEKLTQSPCARGFVVAVDPYGKFLVVFTNDDRFKTIVVSADKTTTITKSGRIISLADIEKGDVVEIVHVMVAGKDVAKTINIVECNAVGNRFKNDTGPRVRKVS